MFFINKVLSTPTREYFNFPGHILADIKTSIIEQIRKNYEHDRKRTQIFKKYLINTFYEGLIKEK